MTPNTDRNHRWGNYDFKAPLRRARAETYTAKICYKALLRHYSLRRKTSQYTSENPNHDNSHLTDIAGPNLLEYNVAFLFAEQAKATLFSLAERFGFFWGLAPQKKNFKFDPFKALLI